MKIGIGQLNPTVGDFALNKEKLIGMIEEAKEKGVELLIFPELVTTGCPPRDLLFRRDFIDANLKTASSIVLRSQGIGIIFGYVERETPPRRLEGFTLYEKSLSTFLPGVLYNSSIFAYNRRILKRVRKIHLPSYDFFNEQRYFAPGEEIGVVGFKGKKLGINIGEDIWAEEVVAEGIKKGAEVIVNISADPFYIGKDRIRSEMIREKARRHGCDIIYANICGGQDDLIFDGGSFAVSRKGRIYARGKRFAEELLIFELGEKADFCPAGASVASVEEVISALSLGLADYTRKNGFKKACLGISGGIDSAVCAYLAVRALGRENVLGVIMPGPFTKEDSVGNAERLARNLQIETVSIDINKIYEAYLDTLQTVFKGKGFDTTEENIQARIRGNILMALANKFGYLVISTGNKSEMAVGYTTLYGDMAGGISPISDLPKTLIYKIARYVNKCAGKEIIPEGIIKRPPSAELRPNQEDEKDLLPYSVLDKILHHYIEENMTPAEIIRRGFRRGDVRLVVSLYDKAEYKRKQAPLGLKVTYKSVSIGRRLPITNR